MATCTPMIVNGMVTATIIPQKARFTYPIEKGGRPGTPIPLTIYAMVLPVEENMIHAEDVAIASCTGTPKMQTRIGRMISPPPIPMIPDTRPNKKPAIHQ